MAIRSRKCRHPLRKHGGKNLQEIRKMTHRNRSPEEIQFGHGLSDSMNMKFFFRFPEVLSMIAHPVQGVEKPDVCVNKSILKLCSFDLCLEYVKMCKSGYSLQKESICLLIFILSYFVLI